MTVKPLVDHEALFVESFVIAERKQRWLEGLANLKRRNQFLSRLADPRDFNQTLMRPIPRLPVEPLKFSALLSKFISSSDCFVISQIAEVDGRYLSVDTALAAVLGMGLGSIISLSPGQVAFYEEESPACRWVLLQDHQRWENQVQWGRGPMGSRLNS